ncbi:MAG: hypothetical protein AAGI03_08945 [Pseudomonadota bacterium]
MALIGRLGLGLLAVLLSFGCGGPGEGSDLAQADTAEVRQVGPEDFAVRRCSAVTDGVGCLIVQAGGKTLLFGAPEGAMESLQAARVDQPDGLFASSLDPTNLEGVARLRNQSWRLGRTVPLLLAGPDGVASFAAGLDQAFARPDAFVYIEERPRGDFDAVLIAPLEVPAGAEVKVFDTGDLRVDGVATPSSAVTYVVRYGGRSLEIEPCLGTARRLEGVPVSLALSCEAQSGRSGWPGASGVIWLDR